MRNNRGFTLIELLVVISIIALLASVVMSALGSARSRASDNAVKAAMKQMRIQGQNYRDTQPSFGASVTTCNAASPTPHLFKSDPTMVLILANIAQNAATGATVSCTTNSLGTQWAVSVNTLRGGGSWCIDNSQGWFKPGAANASGQCS